MSELTNPWEPWQRLIDSIGSYYRGRLFKARDRATAKLGELDEEELGAIASEGRRIASSLDEEGARLTVSLTDDRERHSKLASELQQRGPTARSAGATDTVASPPPTGPCRCGRARCPKQSTIGGSPPTRTSSSASSATPAATCIRGSSDTRTSSVAAWPPSSCSRPPTARCTTCSARQASRRSPPPVSPPIARSTSGALERLVKERGDARQLLLFQVAAELYDREQGVLLGELLHELDGEDLDRVLQAIAMVKRRQLTIPECPRISGYAPPSPRTRKPRNSSAPAQPNASRIPLARRSHEQNRLTRPTYSAGRRGDREAAALYLKDDEARGKQGPPGSNAIRRGEAQPVASRSPRQRVGVDVSGVHRRGRQTDDGARRVGHGSGIGEPRRPAHGRRGCASAERQPAMGVRPQAGSRRHPPGRRSEGEASIRCSRPYWRNSADETGQRAAVALPAAQPKRARRRLVSRPLPRASRGA